MTELQTRTKYTYDGIHRELARTYSNSDPTVTTVYDQSACLGLTACQNIGHRTSVTDAAGSESWAYQVDKTHSRSIYVNQRTTSSITKTSTYYFDLAGNLTQLVYPTGRTVNYTFDAANRPTKAEDSSNGITYATGFQTSPGATCNANVTCYTPQGTIYAVSLGQTSTFTGLNITDAYNTRLQPGEFKASSTGGSAIDISYNYVDPVNGGNAGHVWSITNNLNSGRTQSFNYDQVNRIISAGTAATTGSICWGYQYIYDNGNGTTAAWGNLTSQPAWSPIYNACTQPTMPVSTSDGNNHLSSLAYDAAGNATSDGAFSYAWNAEGQLKSAATTSYTYDGDGRRAAKVGSKLYWYGSGGEILAETNASGSTLNEYIFFGGKRVAMLPSGSAAQFYAEDALGSSRTVTTNTGVVCYDADFAPYGAENAITNSCTQNVYKFEGKERDAETSTLPGDANGNDYFGARYYSNRYGRWLSADWSNVPAPVPYANLTNPQTLDLYSMVSDDPESFADLDGHEREHGLPEEAAEACARGVVAACDTDAEKQQAIALSKSQAQQQNMDKVAMSAETAAIKPTRDSVKNGNYHEYGGLILERDSDGHISSTKPISGQERTVDVDSIHVPKGYTVVGEYHTHPHATAAEGQGPSTADIYRLRTPERASRVGYVVDSYSGVVYRYTQSEPVRGPYDTKVYGTAIGTIP